LNALQREIVSITRAGLICGQMAKQQEAIIEAVCCVNSLDLRTADFKILLAQIQPLTQNGNFKPNDD
jgi:hypothetical protein